MIDKNYCMSHYLAFRYIKDENINFYEGLSHYVCNLFGNKEMYSVDTIDDIEKIIIKKIKDEYVPNKTAIFLSGGIDSAILASYLPEGTLAYTFRCVVPTDESNVKYVDETSQAKKYADKYKLKHEIIDMYWSDFENLTPEILKHDGVPFHSIEVQLVKALKYVKERGIEHVIFGECADSLFGGLNKILSKDWDIDEFQEFFNFTDPKKVLKNPVDVSNVYEQFRLPGNKIDFQKFFKEIYIPESSTSYLHALDMTKVSKIFPYSYMKLSKPLDLNRIRNGEPKYFLRELFKRRYPEIPVPDKIPMPRATEEWLKNYKPVRPEFIENCTEGLTGDQKWQIWCLEQFLNMHEPLNSVYNA